MPDTADFLRSQAADGRWAAAYAPASTAEIPADLQAALNANPQAAGFFANLKGANRYAILYRMGSVSDLKREPERSLSMSPCWSAARQSTARLRFKAISMSAMRGKQKFGLLIPKVDQCFREPRNGRHKNLGFNFVVDWLEAPPVRSVS